MSETTETTLENLDTAIAGTGDNAVAAAAVVECIDFQRHAGVFIRIVCGN